MPRAKRSQAGAGTSPADVLRSTEFKRRALKLLNTDDLGTGRQALGDIKEVYTRYDDDWFNLDYREAPTRTSVEHIVKLSRDLGEALKRLSPIAVKEIHELGFDQHGQSAENRIHGLDFPKTQPLLFHLQTVCEDWVEKYATRKNQAAPTRKAAGRLYNAIFEIYWHYNEYGGDEDNRDETEYINSLAEFADFVLTSVDFKHPDLGQATRGRRYDGAFGRLAFEYFNKKYRTTSAR